MSEPMLRFRAGVLACVLAGVLAGAVLVAAPAQAQQLSGVFGPGVTEGDRSVEWRSACAPSEDGDRSAHRLHYQHALSDALRLRVVAFGSQTPRHDLRLSELRGELQWQYREKRDGLASALRFDLRLDPRNSGPTRLGVNWTHQYDWASGWRARAIATSSVELGDDSEGGASLGARFGLNRSIGGGARAGLESFSSFGNWRDFGAFEDQSHALGPAVTLPIGEDWQVLTGVLFGVTDRAPDTDVRLWLGRSF